MSRTLFENEFIAIRENQGYYYAHMTRTSGHLIAIVPYRKINNTTQYLARVEICPAHSLEYDLYSITGGVTVNETKLNAAQRELMEESGYSVEQSHLIHLGDVRPSKQSDTLASLFTVDLSDIEQQAISGDGSKWEKGASVKWVSYEGGLQIVDPIFVTGMCRTKEMLNASKS